MRKWLVPLVLSTVAGATLYMWSGDALYAEGGVEQGTYRSLTEQERRIQLSNTDLVITHHGNFKRTEVFPSDYEKHQIAHSHEEINSDTRLVVLDFGIFVKE